MRLVDFLEQSFIVKRHIIFQIHFCYMYEAFRLSYARIRNLSEVYHYGSPKALPGRRAGLGASPKAAILKHRDMGDEAYDIVDTERISSNFSLYHKISTLVLVYTFVKHTIPVESLVGRLNPELPAHCYVAGRLIINRSIHQVVAWLFSAFHLSWRLYHHYVRKDTQRTLLFLLQNDQDIQRQYMLLGIQFGGSGALRMRPGDSMGRTIMCHPVEYKRRTVFRLRLNRTIEARHKLRHLFAKINAYNWILFAASALIITPWVLYKISDDSEYVAAYPSCSPQLDELERGGRLNGWSFTYTNHRAFALLVDFVENLFIYVDTGFAFYFVAPLAFVMNYDLELVWRPIETKLALLSQRLKQKHLKERDSAADCQATRRPLVASLADFRPGEEQRLESSIRELQWQLYDFFRQVEYADVLVSDMITFAAIIWVTTFGIMTYHAIVVGGSTPTSTVRLVQLAGFMTFICSSLPLISLHRRVNRSYVVICAIMAYDRSSFKGHFTEILDFYTIRHRSAYTIFHQYPYVTTTCLTLISWTISCAIILETLYRCR